MSTTYHYTEGGKLAVCGQLADGSRHTTHSAGVLRGLARPSRPNAIGRLDICAACLSVATETEAATR